ncbi:MAG TPA: hypothetical protein VL995_04255 [Cellvibrio sp.]|nr:hypothetical protein [Cellvibrio sp.]
MYKPSFIYKDGIDKNALGFRASLFPPTNNNNEVSASLADARRRTDEQ